MKRKIALALSMLLAAGSLSACSMVGGLSNIEIPEFAETDGIKFSAYQGPTVENWSGGQNNVNTITDEHFQKFQEAGFTHLIGVREGARVKANTITYADGTVDATQTVVNSAIRAEEDALRVLELAEKYGIKYYVRDWAFYDMNNTETWKLWQAYDTYEKYEEALRIMFNENTQYIHSSAYAGNFGRDEPGVDQFERLAWQIDIYQKLMEEYGAEGEFLLNMLPSYGGITSYGGATYNEYIDRYFNELAPKLGYICYDFYPFKRAEGGSQMKSGLAANLALVANKCKGTNYELRTFVQCEGDWTGLRDLTSIGDFRLQVYMNLAFGSTYMTYYEYGTFKSQDEGEFGLLNLQDGTYNYTYDMVKQVNSEVHAFEDAYLNFKWDGVLCYSSLAKGKINPKFKEVTPKMKSHPRIADVKHERDALIGAFKDAEGKDAFMLVNYNDPYYNESNEVTIQFNDAKALLMYRFGQQEVVRLPKSGKYTFKLYPGEGRFIIPLS